MSKPVMIRMDEALYARIVENAKKYNRSIPQEIAYAYKQYYCMDSNYASKKRSGK